ncbi:hypothetical protein [Sphingobium chlorophenolicum]|uniref:hypothetical protein n=1 Tax=Sphingobium chlorophenolicum TaxID=46429 RepID=UPI001F3750E1|nr:hypothetical protein [Sphingobium chlorophenolicum]
MSSIHTREKNGIHHNRSSVSRGDKILVKGFSSGTSDAEAATQMIAEYATKLHQQLPFGSAAPVADEAKAAILNSTPKAPSPFPSGSLRGKLNGHDPAGQDSGALAVLKKSPITLSGASLAQADEARLDGDPKARRVRVSGYRRVLGRGLVRADEWDFHMSTKDPATAAASPADAAAPREALQAGAMPMASPERPAATPQRSAVSAVSSRAITEVSGGARPPPHTLAPSSGERLLTPRDILSRLSMTSAEPTKWMRRIFNKHGVPYVHACGKMRATEEQYQLLLEKITCSPSAPVGRTAFTISEAQSRSATSRSSSKNSVQEQVTQMLRRT